MPLIPYPSVPNYPGVPPIPRAPGNASSGSALTVQLPSSATMPAPSQYEWRIYSLATGEDLFTPENGYTLSLVSYSPSRQMNVCDFPVEAPPSSSGSLSGAAFASYNKVWVPAKVTLSLALDGNSAQQASFLGDVDEACESASLFAVQTPDASQMMFANQYTLESYSYQRTSDRGATILIVDLTFIQIEEVTPYLTNSSQTQIKNPQSPSASSTLNGGSVNTSTPSPSTTSSFARYFAAGEL